MFDNFIDEGPELSSSVIRDPNSIGGSNKYSVSEMLAGSNISAEINPVGESAAITDLIKKEREHVLAKLSDLISNFLEDPENKADHLDKQFEGFISTCISSNKWIGISTSDFTKNAVLSLSFKDKEAAHKEMYDFFKVILNSYYDVDVTAYKNDYDKNFLECQAHHLPFSKSFLSEISVTAENEEYAYECTDPFRILNYNNAHTVHYWLFKILRVLHDQRDPELRHQPMYLMRSLAGYDGFSVVRYSPTSFKIIGYKFYERGSAHANHAPRVSELYERPPVETTLGFIDYCPTMEAMKQDRVSSHHSLDRRLLEPNEFLAYLKDKENISNTRRAKYKDYNLHKSVIQIKKNLYYKEFFPCYGGPITGSAVAANSWESQLRNSKYSEGQAQMLWKKVEHRADYRAKAPKSGTTIYNIKGDLKTINLVDRIEVAARSINSFQFGDENTYKTALKNTLEEDMDVYYVIRLDPDLFNSDDEMCVTMRQVRYTFSLMMKYISYQGLQVCISPPIDTEDGREVAEEDLDLCQLINKEVYEAKKNILHDVSLINDLLPHNELCTKDGFMREYYCKIGDSRSFSGSMSEFIKHLIDLKPGDYLKRRKLISKVEVKRKIKL